jgi:hypothetical protein
LTLTVFAENRRAKELYARQGWQVEVETHYKALAPLTKDAEPSAEDDDPRSAE